MERTQRTSGWGRFPVIETVRRRARCREDLRRAVDRGEPLLPQGNCRSYGDACLFSRVLSVLEMNHLLAFDAAAGLVRAEAGVTLDDLLAFAVPRGWFLPVTPGTKHPTLGGCVAADIHGKNHHRHGSIGAFVDELEMVLADGSMVRCSRSERPDLFAATLGGMGLTGLIYAASLRLLPIDSSYLAVHTRRTASLEETCRVLQETQEEYIYSVAWVDALCSPRQVGRGLVMLGNHTDSGWPAGAERLAVHRAPRIALPEHLAPLALNRVTARLFNLLYYHRQWRDRAEAVVHYDPFFYPLDAVSHWNRVYGPRGFLQYQYAVPFEGGLELLAETLEVLGRHRPGCSLAVLKTFGAQEGLLSFPMAGFTLAMDFPVADGRIVELLRGFTDRVVAAGGRIYLAKDALMEPSQFGAMYPRLEEFRTVRRRYDPQALFRSVQSDRLGLT
ncbi:MAG: FAD-binding oxidoreductase [Gemmatimonadota bacterium]